MEKLKQLLEIFIKIKEVVLVISAIIVVILNLFLSSKLAPLVEADRNTDYRIRALEENKADNSKRLERIEDKIDRLIER